MNRETEFQRTIKWFIYGAAGICALCQIVLLFYEFSFFNGIGMLFNGLYHLAGIGAPVLVFILFFKMNEDKEVYSNYGLALYTFLGVVVDLVLIIKYIINLKETKGFNVGIIIGLVLLMICEIFFGLIYIWYGLDKVTSVLPLLSVVIVSIFRGGMLSAVDSALSAYAYNNVKGTVLSVWTFMHLMFYIAFVVCLILYLDSDSLLEIIRNPRDLFTKNTFFGTYTNLYMKEDNKKNTGIEVNTVMTGPNTNQINMQGVVNQSTEQSGGAIGKCPDCGNIILANQSICAYCGCPAELAVKINVEQTYVIPQVQENNVQNNASDTVIKNTNNTNVESNMTDKELFDDMVCPDCGNKVYPDQSVCPTCGNPSLGFIKKITADYQEIETNKENHPVIKKCPDCGNDIVDGEKICSKCGCPL